MRLAAIGNFIRVKKYNASKYHSEVKTMRVPNEKNVARISDIFHGEDIFAFQGEITTENAVVD